MKENRTFYSTVDPKAKRKFLTSGTALAALGVIPIVLAGALLPLDFLNKYGWAIFLFGSLIIPFGLLPYLRLVRLEANPHRLMIEQGRRLTFAMGGSPIWSCDINLIEHVYYQDDPQGIGIKLKDRSGCRFVPQYIPENYFKEMLERYGCDLFLPYFSKRTLESILKKNLSK